MHSCNGVAALGLLEQAGQFPNYPNVWWLSEPKWLGYSGNYYGKEVTPSSVSLQQGVYAYILDYSDYVGGLATVSIDSSEFGFTATETGGEIRLIMKMPSLSANIPTFSFGSNIKFADFEEIDRWEEGRLYCLTLYTNDSGSHWVVSDVEVYEYPEYCGNYKMIESDPDIELAEGVGVYLVDLSESTGGSEEITIDSTDFGFTDFKTGGAIQVILKLPETEENIPTITFGNNVTFADFEEIDRWEAGKTYVLDLNTNNSGTNWVVSNVEVY